MSLAYLIDVIFRRKWIILAIVVTGMIALHAVVNMLPVQYGYMALLNPGKLGTLSDSGKSHLKGSSFLDLLAPSVSTGGDLEVYLTFMYGPQLGAARHNGAFLKEVKSHLNEGSSYLELVAYAPSLEQAKAFLLQVLADLQENFKPKLDAHMAQIEMQIQEVDKQLERKEEEIQRIDDALKNLGLIPQLAEQKEQYATALLNLNYMRQNLKTSISPIHMSNHSFELLLPMGDRPVSPNYLKLFIAGFAGITGGALYAALLLDAILAAKKRSAAATEQGGAAEEKQRSAA